MNKKIKLIVIVGATATYKTTLAIEIAKKINGEIINCDAFQVYKELNVGTNKPSINKIKDNKIHLLNIKNLNEEFNISIFQSLVRELINEIDNRNHVPILCGGSNLYIDSVIKNYALNKYPDRSQIHFFDEWEYENIYNYVFNHNEELAKKINFNNKKRIIRAAQQIYWDETHNKTFDDNNMNYDYLVIETVLERSKLYEKINNRVDEMINQGWINEVIELNKKYKDLENNNSFNAIGYKQILFSIQNNGQLDVEKIKQLTRNYAKRQITWNNNKYDNLVKFNYLTDSIDELLNKYIYSYLEKK